MENADPIEHGERRRDIIGTVIDVVGDTDRVKAREPQGLAANLRVGKKTLSVVRAPRRQMQTAFQIAEHDIGGVQLGGNMAERNRRIGDVHQIDITRQSQFARHFSSPINAANSRS